jgi:hypothetical protein
LPDNLYYRICSYVKILKGKIVLKILQKKLAKAAFILFAVWSYPACADDITKLLIAAIEPNQTSDGRLLDSGVPVRALIDAGYLRRKPEARIDYVDVRMMRKPFDFLGAQLLIVEEEYLVDYIGCCVDPGISLVLDVTSGGGNISKLATANSCSYSEDGDYIRRAAADAGITIGSGRLAYLDCGTRNLSP